LIAQPKKDHFRGRFTGRAKRWPFVVALAMIGTVGISGARADETQAKSLLKAMSDYLAGQKAISFDYDSNLEIVSTQQQKIGLASSGTLTLNRPDKLHATRSGGFANVEMVFDGKTLTLLGKNAYAQVEAPGTIDQLVWKSKTGAANLRSFSSPNPRCSACSDPASFCSLPQF
jgi:hypothetical protein